MTAPTVPGARPPEGVPVRCRAGGWALCPDDMCHGVDRTLCGLWVHGCGFDNADVCDHGFVPETCPTCGEDDYDDPDPEGVDFDDQGRYVGG